MSAGFLAAKLIHLHTKFKSISAGEKMGRSILLIPSSCKLLGVIFLLLCSQIEAARKNSTSSIPAILIFGDSTVDPGNNNYITTIFKSNFPPYGKDYPFHIPTGRFTDGKLVTDFISSYAGIKEEIPAYLDPTLSIEELLSGVSFASAGTGYDPFTAELSDVISMPQQLEYFKEYIEKMNRVIGKERTSNHVAQSCYIVSCGTNDFAVNYFTVPIQRKKYSVEQYQLFLLNKFGEFLQGLRGLGARTIAVVGLPPFGCLPAIITIHPDYYYPRRECIESYNVVARDYNKKLQHYLGTLGKHPHGSGQGRDLVVYGDIYKPLDEMIYRPSKFGFEEWRSGCCGTGLIEAAILCNPPSLVCGDASKYVFWDAIHPTEKAYYLIFSSLRPLLDTIL